MKLIFPHRNLEFDWNVKSVKPWIALEEMEDWERKLFDFLSEWSANSTTMVAQTSGSTGKPKSIKLEKTKMINSAKMTIDHFKLRSYQTALLCLSVDFIAGKMMVIRSILADLCLIAVSPTSTPLSDLQHLEIDFAAMVPLQVSNSLKELNLVKKLIIGGGVVNESLHDELHKISTQCWNTYGMTETITHIAVKPLNGNDKSEFYSTLENIDLSLDERGCLIIDAPFLSENSIITNDCIKLIDNTHFQWLGRWDNIINSGGIKISPEEIEKLISPFLEKPFFIGGIPDKKFENILVLLIEDDTWDEAKQVDFLDQLSHKLPRFKSPKKMFFLSEFSYTSSEKIKRKESLAKVLIQ